MCLNVFYTEAPTPSSSNGNCDAEWGVICFWHCYGCGEGQQAESIISLPNLDKVTTGIVFIKFQYNGKLDKTGKPMIAYDNILMGDEFNKLAKCDAAYLLKGEYTIQKGNIATMAIYVVNHKI
jgi:hypothetical protein